MKKNKLFHFVAAVGLLMLATACGGKYKTYQGDVLNTKEYTLENGLKVFMSVNKEQPRIQTYIAVRVGGKNDPAETTGLAHYFEHLMFKGTQQFGTSDYNAEKPMLDSIESLFEIYRKTTDESARAALYHQIDSISYEASKIAIPNEYDKLMSVIGARGTNAWTSTDETVYVEDIPSNQIDAWARIQADRFKNMVIRGFHTELETIYEEKNMSLTKDFRKAYEKLSEALFAHHPYGTQTVLGTQESLKNPSIKNVKAYHDQYYVPNNVAICLSGDFDPDEMVTVIEKHFGDWKANPDIPELKFEQETPISKPIVKETCGLEAEFVYMGWRLPGARDLKTTAVAEIACDVLCNGQAGLVDIDLNQKQKVISASIGLNAQPDYSSVIAAGHPKTNQTLEAVRDLLLEEVTKLQNGEFDESLIQSTINNIKLSRSKMLTDNGMRAKQYVDAFINGIDWKDACKDVELLETVTKADVIAFAKEYLGPNNYAIVYKRQAEDTTVKKIAAPKITPIATNRDKQSPFLTEIAETKVKPIEPVFVDFSKDMSKFKLDSGLEVLYKYNEMNDIFNLQYQFNIGSDDDPALLTAFSYIQHLGTKDKTAEDIAKQFYALACDFNVSVGFSTTTISLEGLSENMPTAIRLLDDLLKNAEPNDTVLMNIKADMLKRRFDSMKSQSACFSALQRYQMFGKDYIKRSTLPNEAILGLTSDSLLAKAHALINKSHRILYYGPETSDKAKSILKDNHQVGDDLAPIELRFLPYQPTPAPEVNLVQYDAKQIYYLQYSNRGEKFNPALQPVIQLYNEYFGGGMNSIVFQEMREARGLAYSASSYLVSPQDNKVGDYYYYAFIATQNDKMKTAVEAFSDIINQMPTSEAAFAIAKEALLSKLRTARTTGLSVLSTYISCEYLGLTEPLSKAIFEAVQNMTLEDVVKAQEEMVKNRTYTYGILGDVKDLDTNYLKTLGTLKTVSLEDIFGYKDPTL